MFNSKYIIVYDCLYTLLWVAVWIWPVGFDFDTLLKWNNIISVSSDTKLTLNSILTHILTKNCYDSR